MTRNSAVYWRRHSLNLWLMTSFHYTLRSIQHFFEQYKGNSDIDFISGEGSHTQIGPKFDFGLLNNKYGLLYYFFILIFC